jgi:hypothetical protein
VLAETDALPRLLAQVREAFNLTSVTLLERTATGWQPIGSAGTTHYRTLDAADADVAVEPDVHLVGSGRVLPAGDRRLFETVAGQALLAVRNQRTAADAAEVRRRAEATELRTALLSAVGPVRCRRAVMVRVGVRARVGWGLVPGPGRCCWRRHRRTGMARPAGDYVNQPVKDSGPKRPQATKAARAR